jgi:Protein of unknown function (DUF2853)
MTKFQEAIALYTSFMSDKLNRKGIDESVLVALAEMLGPSIYDADASLVACSDKNELKRVKELFLIRDLKMADSADLDKSIKTVCGIMGSSNRKKYRVVFYYLLLEEFNSLHLYSSAKKATKTVTTKATAKTTATSTGKTAATTTGKTVAATKAKTVATTKEKTIVAPKTTTTTKRTITVSAKSAQAAETVTLANAPIAAETLKLVITEAMAFNEKVEVYKTLIVSYLNFPDMNETLLANLTNTVEGAATVNIKSAVERNNIKENFLKGRLGVYDADLDAAIDVVNSRMGNTPKYRPVFYYLLTKHLGREWVITEPNTAVMY